MKLIKIGILVNTHALKGEVRIISNFEFKDRVFKVGNKLYIGNENTEVIIKSYRVHKNYDMVTFNNYDSINEVLKFKGKEVYFNEEDLVLNEGEYLDNELINLSVIFNGKIIGKISDVEINKGKKLFNINGKLIPYNENFIEKIDIESNEIILKNIDGLI